MKKNRLAVRSIILIVLVGALAYTLYSNFFNEKQIVSIGDPAPNFVLTDLNGNQVEFDSYRGKGVFLNFWGTWCKPCEKEMPYMESQYQVYKDQGVEILAVNVGEPELNVKNFVDRFGLTFPVVIDKKLEVLDAYGVDPLPTSFLIDKDGEIVDVLIGSLTEETIRNHMERIKP